MDDLATERENRASEGIDARSTEEILRIINSEDRTVAEAVAAEIPRITQAVDRIVEAAQAGGRLFYAGAGTSGRLGVLDASECPPTFQVPPEFVQGIIAGGEAALTRSTEAAEDDPAAGAADLRGRGFTGADVLVGIAASGRTPYVLGAVDEARRLGADTIGLSANVGSELARRADIAIVPRTGPEIIAGSTRMKAGTAAKLVLNMISTAVMIRLGMVYGNLMVNVRPVNAKLAGRARRIVANAGRVDAQRAEELLAAAGNDVRTAILMARFGAEREEAEKRLAESAGRLSEAINRWKSS